MVFEKSYLPFLPFTETLVTKFVKRYQLCVYVTSFGRIKQIHHVWEGYLRKIPVLRLNFPVDGSCLPPYLRCTFVQIKKTIIWFYILQYRCNNGIFVNTSYDLFVHLYLDWYFSQIPLPNMIYLYYAMTTPIERAPTVLHFLMSCWAAL